MASEFLLGGLGLIIVLSLVFGGMTFAHLCHQMFTPNLGVFYAIWLWLCLIPFWWLFVRTLATERIEHPVAAYVGFLPIVVLVHILISQLGPGNPWLEPAMMIASIAYFIIAERVRNVFARQ